MPESQSLASYLGSFFWDERDIVELRKAVEDLDERYDGIDFNFKEPWFIFSSAKITCRAPGLRGTVSVGKNNGGYRVFPEARYNSNVRDMKEGTAAEECLGKDGPAYGEDACRCYEDSNGWVNYTGTRKSIHKENLDECIERTILSSVEI